MKNSSDLFLLIKAMSGAEKRYFKLFSALYDRDKNYLKLFNAIVRQKNNYDEAKLTGQFKKEKWIKNISNTKYELYNAILSSMEVYHKKDSIDARLASYMNQVNMLHDKRLFGAAKKLIAKVEKLAREHEKHHYLIMANSVKVVIMTKLMNVKELDQYVNSGGYEREMHNLKCLENNSEFLNINLQLTKATELYVRTNETKEIRELSNSELLSSPDKALTFYSLRNYYYINYICHARMGKMGESAYKQQKEWIDYLEKDKNKLVSRAGIYLSGLIRLIGTINHTNLESQLEPVFIKAKDFYHRLPDKIKSSDLKSAFMGVTGNYMEGQIKLHKPQKAIEAWESIKHLVPYDSLAGESKMVTSANLSFAHFLMQEYRKANKYLANIINYNEQARPDIQGYARIFILFVNYELGNYDSLLAVSQASKRYLIKYQLLDKFESKVIQFFQKDVFRFLEIERGNVLFELLKKDLTKLKLFSKTRTAQNFDIVSWLDSKIEKRPFAEILKERTTAGNYTGTY